MYKHDFQLVTFWSWILKTTKLIIYTYLQLICFSCGDDTAHNNFVASNKSTVACSTDSWGVNWYHNLKVNKKALLLVDVIRIECLYIVGGSDHCTAEYHARYHMHLTCICMHSTNCEGRSIDSEVHFKRTITRAY